MSGLLFDYLPKDAIVAAFERSPGNELSSGKFASAESSAALAANTFGLFLTRPGDLPPLPGTAHCGWPARYVSIEECVRFPWHGGQHPWLDAFVETGTHIIGVESKRYEPFRAKQPGEFSAAYWRDVWGEEMAPFERMRDRLASGELTFKGLDAAQLVKHAFGLVTEGGRRSKAPVLLYLYAEPEVWGDGKPVATGDKVRHVREVEEFAREVAGAAVGFRSSTYRELLAVCRESPIADVRRHADEVAGRFEP